MYTLDVLYLGKQYTFTADNSLDLADLLEQQFGRIVRSRPSELYSEYWTSRDAHAYLY